MVAAVPVVEGDDRRPLRDARPVALAERIDRIVLATPSRTRVFQAIGLP
jgi:hypothetical protein